MTTDDPVVKRVRDSRKRIVEQFGRDPVRLLEWAKRIEDTWRERVVSYEQPKPSHDKDSR